MRALFHKGKPVLKFFCVNIGSLNENGPTDSCMKIWPPHDGTVWEGLDAVALLEKACQWRWALRFQDSAMPVCSLPPAFG